MDKKVIEANVPITMYLNDVKDGTINDDQDVQRKFCSDNSFVNGIGITVLTGDYLPPIVLCDVPVGDGVKQTYIADGKQRTAALSEIRFGNYRFTSTTEDGFSDEEKSAVLNSFEIIEDTNNTSEDTNTDTSTNNEYTLVAYDLTNLELAWIEIGIIFIAGVVLTIFAIKRNPKNKLYILAIILLVLQVAAVKGYEIQYGSTKGITEDVAYNIGFFVLAIIGIILLIIQVAKKPKQEQEIKAEKEENKVEQEPVKELEENKDTSQEKEVIEEKKEDSEENKEDKE